MEAKPEQKEVLVEKALILWRIVSVTAYLFDHSEVIFVSHLNLGPKPHGPRWELIGFWSIQFGLQKVVVLGQCF